MAEKHGFRVERIGSSRPFFMGLNIHKTKLISPDNSKTLIVEDIALTISLKSFFDRTVQFIDLRGLQFSGKLDEIKAFIRDSARNNHDDYSFFDVCHFSGMLNLENEDQTYFIPLEISLYSVPGQIGIDGTLRFVSKDLSTDARIHLDKRGQDLTTNVCLENFKLKIAGFDFLAKRLLFSTLPTPNLTKFSGGQNIDIITKGEDISFDLLNLDKTKNSAVHFDSKTHVYTDGTDLKINGEGYLQLDNQKAKMNLVTGSEELIFDIKAPELQASSFLKLLNHFSGQQFEEIQGEASMQALARFPLNILLNRSTEHNKYSNGKHSAESFFVRFMEILQQETNKGFVKVSLKDVCVSHPLYSIQKLNTNLNFTLFPFQTQGKQFLDAESMRLLKVNFITPKLSFTVNDMLKMQEFTTKTLGGSFRLHSFDMKDLTNVMFLFDVDTIDFLDALTFLEIKGLTGSGQLGGHGQLKFSKEKGLEVINAKFFSTSRTGKISYIKPKQDNLIIDAEEQDNQSHQLMDILKNLTFTTLAVEILPSEGRLQAVVEIMGYNPSVTSGYPYRFKIKTSGDLQETIQSSLNYFIINENWNNLKKDLNVNRTKNDE